MRVPALCVGLLVCASLVLVRAADGRSDVVQRTFKASPGGRLVIDADRGSITVEGHSGQDVNVEVHRKVTRGSDSAAADLLERHQVRFSERDGVIKVETEVVGEKRWNWRGPQLEVDIRVRLPREFDLQAETAGGSIRVEELSGEVAIRTSGGSLTLDSVAGRVQGKTSGGSIGAMNVSGVVELTTSGGSIHVAGAAGERLKVSTSGGSIRLEEIGVPADAQTSGGSVTVETSATPLNASTSGGSVSARLTRSPESEVSLRTSAGGITVNLPADSEFNLDASTSAGSVKSDFPVAVTTAQDKERSSLRGPVNGGGPLLKLRTSAGGIRVRKS